ncbi:hypothetical protein CEXT_475101 [Caerostris extrusa]|uniref:Uncharacterized protein n=1 Tax=Caerostris extrusa TaxID=172846 RepID=A0AAV4NYC7_CAEEX|nr:hypothetical protein CEXT_475101 [Caerostris extrusa]
MEYSTSPSVEGYTFSAIQRLALYGCSSAVEAQVPQYGDRISRSLSTYGYGDFLFVDAEEPVACPLEH